MGTMIVFIALTIGGLLSFGTIVYVIRANRRDSEPMGTPRIAGICLMLFLFGGLFMFEAFRLSRHIGPELQEYRTRRAWERSFSQSWVDSFVSMLPSPQSFGKQPFLFDEIVKEMKPPVAILMQHGGWHVAWNKKLHARDVLARSKSEVRTAICIYTWAANEATDYYWSPTMATINRHNVHALAVAFDPATGKAYPLEHWQNSWTDPPYAIQEGVERGAAWKRLRSAVEAWMDSVADSVAVR